ncbi:MAG: hypothetical protein P8Y13_16710 [Deinococcales bacterium]
MSAPSGAAAVTIAAAGDIACDPGADVVPSGHDPDHERFAPQEVHGALDTAHGMVQFVVGTHGTTRDSIPSTIANSLAHNDDTYGVLKLTLEATSYDWQFVPEAGQSYADAGSASCH